MAMKFLNKLYTKCIFSDAQEMNVTAYDMGENMTSISLEEDVVNRLKTATGTVGSLSIFVSVSVSISILKTSPAIDVYMERILNNGFIGGTLTLYDDVNRAFTIEDVSLNLNEIPNMNGTEPAVPFTLQGNLLVNKDALGIA
ncbi:TPA: hypothetical protein RTG57_001725 [Campylobacter jejuni]|nr:hypothetical protein [Campylobacter jejuni]